MFYPETLAEAHSSVLVRHGELSDYYSDLESNDLPGSSDWLQTCEHPVQATSSPSKLLSATARLSLVISCASKFVVLRGNRALDSAC